MFTIIEQLVQGIITGIVGPLFGYLNKRPDSDVVKYQTTASLQATEIQASTSIIVAEQQHWYTACVRPLFALPFIIYNFKLILWDKVLAWGATDPLSPDLLKIEMIVIGSYFVGISIEKFAGLRKS